MVTVAAPATIATATEVVVADSAAEAVEAIVVVITVAAIPDRASRVTNTRTALVAIAIEMAATSVQVEDPDSRTTMVDPPQVVVVSDLAADPVSILATEVARDSAEVRRTGRPAVLHAFPATRRAMVADLLIRIAASHKMMANHR